MMTLPFGPVGSSLDRIPLEREAQRRVGRIDDGRDDDLGLLGSFAEQCDPSARCSPRRGGAPCRRRDSGAGRDRGRRARHQRPRQRGELVGDGDDENARDAGRQITIDRGEPLLRRLVSPFGESLGDIHASASASGGDQARSGIIGQVLRG